MAVCSGLPLPSVQVEVLTQQITRMFRKCEARLQQFGGEPSSSAADEKVKRNVQVRLPPGVTNAADKGACTSQGSREGVSWGS